ncbi:hypothetical protein J437_LFUL007104 [Ladona fulva]|uniref:ABC transporter domain-containing protein n=1 Tax=Ladona fulva TaxID=123851 RepID=A0A8K0K2K8_LADFU|nr:hypothetical protein J437_LFUL007104 [Ladona fulva]
MVLWKFFNLFRLFQNSIFNDIETTSANLLYWLIFPHLGLMIMLCLFITLPILEGTNGARNLQLMALSPNVSLYWIVSLLFDMGIYMANIFISLIIYLIISPGSYYRGEFYVSYIQCVIHESIGALLLLLFLFGLCSIPFIYFISYFKNTVGGGVSSTSVVFLVGMLLGVVVAVLEMFGNLSHVSTPLHVIGLIFPTVPFTVGIRKFYITSVYNSKCDAIPYTFKKDLCSVLEKAVSSIDLSCCDNICKVIGNCFKPYSYYKLDNFTPSNATTFVDPQGMGVDFYCLAALVPFYLGILYLIDKGIFASILERILEILTATFRKDFGKKVGVDFEDEDVCKEMDRMDFTLQSECKQEGKDILKVHKLKKNYGWFRWIRGGQQAVRGVSFGVDPGDCFGLLGANGAGKTSTFQMITGTFPSSSGKSYILDEASHGCTGKNTRYLAHVGYCPQFDGVVDALSGRQMLSLYANLQGIPKDSVNKEVQNWLNNLDLNEPADRQCRAYSGGNLRRLGTAMALIGNQPLVCLDEPTAGVDPVARRGMWNVLKSAQSSGSALVLTSHSMEECEALCTKLAIMLNGQFVCIGEVPYLKQKYGQGFTLLVKLNVTDDPDDNTSSNLAKLKEAIETKFHPCIVKDEHQGLIHYQIMNPETKWGYMFSSMEELKRTYHPLVEDYSLSETTLEQVFISFAKQQESVE